MNLRLHQLNWYLRSPQCRWWLLPWNYTPPDEATLVGRSVNCQIWTFHSFSVANIFFRGYVSTTVFLFWSLFTITPPYIGLEKHKFCIHFSQSSNSYRIQVTAYFHQLYPLNGTLIHQILYLRTIASEDNPLVKKSESFNQ